MHLTKSDFTIARTCAAKLYYKKLGYPSLADDNPYLEFLADGGYMVETMAKLLFPEGKKGGISSEWRPYLEDVTFQAMVLRRAFPRFKVIPFLCVVDKAKTATANVTFEKFRLRRSTGARGGWKPEVDYIGNVNDLRKE